MPTQCASYRYVITDAGPKILPVDEPGLSKDEESPADYNAGGYLPLKVGDSFKQGRYRVIRKLGWGHFSTVWLVKDEHSHRHSALKVIKSAGRYAETARDEIKLLSRVASFSPTHPGRPFVVSFLDSFIHQGPEASHICLVFEPLGENLLALIERNKKKGVPRALVKVIAKQVLLGLQYLHDECDLVHTDIKPENILISIPDVESHICSELSMSPGPTSRRVGVPLPTKSRSGVSIPVSQQRSRRQVQIFDSQPLSSPSRSGGFPTGGGSGSNSGANSAVGSYVSQMHMSRLAGAPGSATTASVPKTPNGFAMPGPRPDSAAANGASKKGNVANQANSPSSSSSSSSSSLASTGAASSSIFSTPPTSLSHSFGNAVAGLMGMAKTATSSFEIKPSDVKEHEPVGVPVPISASKGKSKTEIPSSWKDKLSIGVSWNERPSFSISKSPSQSSSSARSNKPNAEKRHSRSGSGFSVSSSWQDPGLAAPAPAVVVSAVIRADGEEDGDYFRNAGVSTSSTDMASSSKSGTSSATVTVARPSPSQPFPPDVGTQPSPPALCRNTPPPPIAVHKIGNPSLLSQTAPPRHSTQIPPISPRKPMNVQTKPKALSPAKKPTAPPPTPNPSRSPSTSRVQDVAPLSETTPTHRRFPSISGPPTLEPVVIPSAIPPAPPISIKIADLGNATPSRKHYTEDIQTRQYRAPEAILGRKDWGTTADIWSVACVLFELLTAEYLFDPQGQGELFTKDDDHMAQIIELLGDFSKDAKMGGKYSADLFDHTGSLRYIRSLKTWPLDRVLVEKYLYSEADSAAICDFLLPMLVVDFKRRAHARDMTEHKWLELSEDEEFLDEW